MAHKKSQQTKSKTSSSSTVPDLCKEGQAKYERVVHFFEKILRHSKGQNAGKPFTLLPWQHHVMRELFGRLNPDGTRQHRVGYIELPKKQGKALALDTPIPTPAGWKCQGDLQVGDEIFAADGQRCFVIGKTPPMHGRPCYQVTFSDGESIIADEDHLWYTEAYRTGLPRTGLGAKSTWEQRHIVSTSQIRDTLTFMASRKLVACNHRVPLAGSLDCEVTDLPIHPYVLGCWLGDGNSDGARITCAYKDIELIENLRSCGVTVVENKSSNEKSGLFAIDSCHKDGASHGCHSKLRLLGVLNNKHIPEQYLRSSREQRLALLQGLMDTDGTASITGKAGVTRCEFGTTKPALRDGFVELARSLGYKPKVCTTIARIDGRPCGEFFRVSFTGFRDTPPFRLSRKLNRLKWMPSRRPRSQYRQIVSVEPVPSVAVCCIQVTAPNGLYLAGKGMIPTHNSTTLAGIALYLTAFDSEPGAECYSAAADREQAGIIYREAASMVRASPAMSRHLEVIDSRKTIIHKASNSFYRVLSADAFRAEGLNIHALLFDELHAQRDRRLWAFAPG